MRNVGHFIGGREVAGTSGRFADVFQPMDGTVIAKVALATKAELREAVENAKAAQPAWAATNPQRRARVMMKFLELIGIQLNPPAPARVDLTFKLSAKNLATVIEKGTSRPATSIASLAARSTDSRRISSSPS